MWRPAGCCATLLQAADSVIRCTIRNTATGGSTYARRAAGRNFLRTQGGSCSSMGLVDPDIASGATTGGGRAAGRYTSPRGPAPTRSAGVSEIGPRLRGSACHEHQFGGGSCTRPSASPNSSCAPLLTGCACNCPTRLRGNRGSSTMTSRPPRSRPVRNSAHRAREWSLRRHRPNLRHTAVLATNPGHCHQNQRSSPEACAHASIIRMRPGPSPTPAGIFGGTLASPNWQIFIIRHY